MLSRKHFLSYSIAGFCTVGCPAICLAAPTSTPKDWELCEHSWALPLDRPLGLIMHGLDGPDIDIVKLRGFAILLNIFTTWCPPCVEEAHALAEAAKLYVERGLRIIGLDYKESDGAVHDFKKKYGITYPIAMDRDGSLTSALLNGRTPGHILFPTSIFISPDGYLYCQRIDAMSQKEVNYRVERFLRDVPPSGGLKRSGSKISKLL